LYIKIGSYTNLFPIPITVPINVTTIPSPFTVLFHTTIPITNTATFKGAFNVPFIVTVPLTVPSYPDPIPVTIPFAGTVTIPFTVADAAPHHSCT
jgi:hypothetical protein